MVSGEEFPSDRVSSGVVADYLAWCELRGLAQNTLEIYNGRLAALQRWLWKHHHVALEDATTEQLTDYRASLRVRDSSVSTYLAIMRGLYRWLVLDERILRDPSLRIPIPRIRRRLPRPIPEDQYWFAIDQAPPRIRQFLVLAGGSGARCCEISALDRPDILDGAWPQPMIQLTGKGAKTRMVPMSPWVWTELQAGGLPRRGPVNLRDDGRPGRATAEAISKAANRFLHSIGLDVTIHQARHRFATIALAGCGNLRTVQELLGHEDPATTAGYTAYSNPEAWKAVLATQPPPVRPVRAVGALDEDTAPMPIEEG